MFNCHSRAIPFFFVIVLQFLFVLPVFADFGCCEQLLGDKPACSDPSCVSSCFSIKDKASCEAFAAKDGSKIQWNSGKCWGLSECVGHVGTACCVIKISDVATCYALPKTASYARACTAMATSAGATDSSNSVDSCNASSNSSVCTGHLEDPNLYKTASSDSTTSELPPPASIAPVITVPKLQIQIPNVSFSAITVKEQGGSKFIDVPYIAQYISGIYTYILGVITLIAVTMIIFGGIKYVTAGGDSSRVASAKTNITNAVIGIFIAFGTYLILSTINPALVTLIPLHIKVVSRIEIHLFSAMDTESGFKDAASADANETAASEGGIDGGPSGGSKPTEQISESCTPKADAASATTCEQKQDLLAKAVLGFKKVCVDQSGCVYVRGGYSALPSGKIMVTANDSTWLTDYFAAHNINYSSWSQDCKDKWADPEYKKGYMKNRTKPEYALFQYPNGKLVTADTDTTQAPFAEHHCWAELQKIYITFLKKTIEPPGIFGGDCGTTLIQILNCAGVKTAQSIQEMAKGSNLIVNSAKNYAEFKSKIDAAGGLAFGDIFAMGGVDPKTGKAAYHNLMYTGGRDDVPFNFFEMGFSPEGGGSGAGDDVQTGTAKLKGDTFNGMAAHGKSSDQLFWNVTRRYPITVVRPYGAECKGKPLDTTGSGGDFTGGGGESGGGGSSGSY